jgi:hypothetical protein
MTEHVSEKMLTDEDFEKLLVNDDDNLFSKEFKPLVKTPDIDTLNKYRSQFIDENNNQLVDKKTKITVDELKDILLEVNPNVAISKYRSKGKILMKIYEALGWKEVDEKQELKEELKEKHPNLDVENKTEEELKNVKKLLDPNDKKQTIQNVCQSSLDIDTKVKLLFVFHLDACRCIELLSNSFLCPLSGGKINFDGLHNELSLASDEIMALLKEMILNG